MINLSIVQIVYESLGPIAPSTSPCCKNVMPKKNGKLLATVMVVSALLWLYLSRDSISRLVHTFIGQDVTDLQKDKTMRGIGPTAHNEAINDRSFPIKVTSIDAPANSSATPDAPTGGLWNENKKTIHFTVAGEVFDAQSGTPIENFTVDLIAQTLRSFDALRELEVGFEKTTEGHFRLQNLGLGTYTLTVRASGYAPSRQTVKLDAVTDNPYLVVPLSQGGRVSGVVVDWRDIPLEGVVVGLGGCGGQRCPETTTDKKGAFLLAGAPEEESFSISATHPRYGTATLPNLKLSPGQTEHVKLKLSGILRVFGHVYRGSQKVPVEGAKVRANDTTILTDSTGAYTIDVPLSGQADVRVVADGHLPVEYASYPESRSTEPIRWVEKETHIAELIKDFLLSMENAQLSGQITEGDKPVAGAKLQLYNNMGWARRGHETFPVATTTNGAGRYQIDNIPAHAAYELRLERSQGDAVERRNLGLIVIDEPQAVTADFALDGASLRGHFLERNTRELFPLNEHNCGNFGARREGSGAVYMARCLGDGSFEIADVPIGRYFVGTLVPKLNIEVVIEGQTVDVTSETALTPIELVVEGKRFVTWTVRVTNTEGQFVADVMLRYHFARGSSTTNLSLSDDGTMQFSVPADRYEIFFDAAGYQPAKINLDGRNAAQVIDVRLSRLE